MIIVYNTENHEQYMLFRAMNIILHYGNWTMNSLYYGKCRMKLSAHHGKHTIKCLCKIHHLSFEITWDPIMYTYEVFSLFKI